MPQFTLNGTVKAVPAQYRKLSYENICVLIGEFNPGNGNVVTVTWFNRKTKAHGSLNLDSKPIAVSRNLCVTAVRTNRA